MIKLIQWCSSWQNFTSNILLLLSARKICLNMWVVVKCNGGALLFCFIINCDDGTVVFISLLRYGWRSPISYWIIWLMERTFNTHFRRERLNVYQSSAEVAHKFLMCSISCIPSLLSPSNTLPLLNVKKKKPCGYVPLGTAVLTAVVENWFILDPNLIFQTFLVLGLTVLRGCGFQNNSSMLIFRSSHSRLWTCSERTKCYFNTVCRKKVKNEKAFMVKSTCPSYILLQCSDFGCGCQKMMWCKEGLQEDHFWTSISPSSDTRGCNETWSLMPLETWPTLAWSSGCR